MTIFDLAPLSEWQEIYKKSQSDIDGYWMPPTLRSMVEAKMMEFLCRYQRDRIMELEREVERLRGDNDLE